MSVLTELAGLHVSVDRVIHMPQLEAPPDRLHPFVYFITIHNDSGVPVTITSPRRSSLSRSRP